MRDSLYLDDGWQGETGPVAWTRPTRALVTAAEGSAPAGTDENRAAGPARQARRLPDRILVAAHQACDLGLLDAAAALLTTLEAVLQHAGNGLSGATPAAQRRAVEGFAAAHARLWHLRHPEHVEPATPSG